MLASPSTSFSTIAWPLEDPISHEHNSYINTEIAASESFVHYPPSQSKVELNRSTPSTSLISSDPTITIVKKLYRNASERDRRKKINSLYSTMRSLLPAADQEKKLSIPATVSRVVKYIPDLQQQVEGLIQKKEVLLSRISRQGEQIHQGNQRQTPAGSSLSAVSENWLNDREVMIQISTYKVQKSPLAEILLNLEEDGFLLLNASSFESFGGRVFYNLHLQVEGTCRFEREVLNEKLMSLYEKGKEFNRKHLGSVYFNDLPI